MNLYELTQQQLELKQQLMEKNLDEQTISDTLEGNAGEIEAKIENYGLVICNEEALNNAMKEVISRMVARCDAHTEKINMLKKRVLTAMIASEISRIECPLFTIAVQDNPPSVDVYNDKLIPAEYMRVPEPKPPVPAPDKRLILADLKAGKEVAGCVLKKDKRIVIK